jgi:hypothetical protein
MGIFSGNAIAETFDVPNMATAQRGRALTRIALGAGAIAVSALIGAAPATAQEPPVRDGGAGTVPRESMPDAVLGYAGFLTPRIESEMVGIPTRYGSLCAPREVYTQYGDPTGHRARTYAVDGFAAHELSGPPGTAGAEVFEYATAEAADTAFETVKNLTYGCEVPVDGLVVPSVSPNNTLWGGPGEPTDGDAFSVQSGNYLAHGGSDSYTTARYDRYIIVGGYHTPPHPDAPFIEPAQGVAVADKAVNATRNSALGLA